MMKNANRALKLNPTNKPRHMNIEFNVGRPVRVKKSGEQSFLHGHNGTVSVSVDKDGFYMVKLANGTEVKAHKDDLCTTLPGGYKPPVEFNE